MIGHFRLALCLQYYIIAENHGLRVEGMAFHILNRVLDEAIGLAVQTFATERALEVQRRREEYLAFVAHDLRSPLNAISLLAAILQPTFSGQGDSAQSAKLLKTLHRNVQRLQSLVEQVLKESDHIRTETGVKLERREFDLWPLYQILKPSGSVNDALYSHSSLVGMKENQIVPMHRHL
jgi:signal transduction histidine kinase